MRPRPKTLGFASLLTLLAALYLADAAGAASVARQCRKACGDEFAACVGAGGHPRACHRSVLGRCKREGVAACQGEALAPALAGSCSSPTVLPAQGGTFGGATSGTSALAGSCGSSSTAPEQVFQWTPTASGTATIQTCGAGTNFDTVLYMRSDTCASGPEVAAGCNDDACTNATGLFRASRLTPSVTLGHTYFIVVDGYGGAQGTFSLTVTPPAPTTTTTTLPGGGGCSSPMVIPASGGTVSGATSGTSALVGSCGSSGTAPERVYQWTPAVSGTATIQTCGAGTTFDTVLYLRSGSCAGGLEVAAGCNDDACFNASGLYRASRLTPTVTAGQTYYIVVDGFNGAQGTFSLTVTPPVASTTTTTPTNSSTTTTTLTGATGACASATPIPAAGGTFSGTTSGTSTLEGSCGSSGASPERVFQWTPAVSGTATIQTCGAGTTFDTELYLRSGSCAGGPEVAAGCNDDACANASGLFRASRLTPTVTAGQTYYIVVDGYGGAPGTFSLTVTPPGASTTTTTPASTSTTTTTLAAACAGPTPIPAAGGTFSGTTSGTSMQAGSCGSSGTSPEQVFQWTPLASGTATIQTCGAGTTFDTVLYLRSGSCASGPEVAAGCNDDACINATGLNRASRLTPTVTAGQTYYIVVDGYGGAQGTFALTVTAPGTVTSTTAIASTSTTTTLVSVDRTVPAVPTGLTAAAASCSQINLSWLASTDTGGTGLKGYNVYRGGAFMKQVLA